MSALAMIHEFYLMTQVAIVGVIGQITDPAPTTDFPGSDLVTTWLGNLKFLGLAGSLASLFIGGAVWGLSNVGGNSVGSSVGRRFALGGAVGAIIVGMGAEIVNTFATP